MHFCFNWLVDWLDGRSVVWLVGWLVGRSVGQSFGRSVGQLVGRSVGWSVGWLIGYLRFNIFLTPNGSHKTEGCGKYGLGYGNVCTLYLFPLIMSHISLHA